MSDCCNMVYHIFPILLFSRSYMVFIELIIIFLGWQHSLINLWFRKLWSRDFPFKYTYFYPAPTDIQHPQIPLIFAVVADIFLLEPHCRTIFQEFLTLKFHTWCSNFVPSQWPPLVALLEDHHHTRPYQNYVGFQGRHRSSPNFLTSRHLHAQIFLLKTLHIFSHLHMVLSIHPGCSISTSPAVHLGATFQPQAQVALSSASYSLQIPSCSIHDVPSSSLRVTYSDAHHIIVALHLIPIVKSHPPNIFQVSNLSIYHRQPCFVPTGV